jgi:hypothetical protein
MSAPDITALLTPRDRADLRKLALRWGVTVDQAAQALLASHMTLIRDCGALLPVDHIQQVGRKAVTLARPKHV